MLIFILNLYVVGAAFSAISYVTPIVIPQYDFNSQILDHNEVSVPSYEESEEQCVPNCASQIFCYGEILEQFQINQIKMPKPKMPNDTNSHDSKDFVDFKLKKSEKEIVAAYEQLKNSTANLTKEVLTKFLDEYFDEFNMTKYKHSPEDFNEAPPVVANIKDPKYQDFSKKLNVIWKELSFKWPKEMKDNELMYSAIYVPNTFIVASAERFREMYYWDSYWIIRGLLVCGMKSTARGIIENMIIIVDKYGYMPNGARIYYLRRSQPPLLIRMASTYYDLTKDENFIKSNLKYFEKEFTFWMNNRSVSVEKNNKTYRMFRYNARSCTPRPESYKEDYNDAKGMNESQKNEFYTGVKSAAESGWDFSSRFIRGEYGQRSDDLKKEDAQHFIPVDLNSMLQYNAQILSEWFAKYGDMEKSKKYKKIASEINTAIQEVLWNEEVGCWLDWDLKKRKSRNFFYPSNVTPLWTKSYDPKNQETVKKVIGYLVDEGLIDDKLKPAYWGVPTSIDVPNSAQQWDYPNTWAPLQSLVIEGLANTDHSDAKKIAFELAARFVKTTYICYNNSSAMHEKYHADKEGEKGKGGEYKPQTGFGWTNGFVLDLLNTYGKNLNSSKEEY